MLEIVHSYLDEERSWCMYIYHKQTRSTLLPCVGEKQEQLKNMIKNGLGRTKMII